VRKIAEALGVHPESTRANFSPMKISGDRPEARLKMRGGIRMHAAVEYEYCKGVRYHVTRVENLARPGVPRVEEAPSLPGQSRFVSLYEPPPLGGF
jgi:hypothetical protein